MRDFYLSDSSTVKPSQNSSSRRARFFRNAEASARGAASPSIGNNCGGDILPQTVRPKHGRSRQMLQRAHVREHLIRNAE